MNSDDTDELPEGWAWATLGDGLALDIQPGFACGANNRDGSGIPHLRPMNVNEDGRISFSDVKYVPADEANRPERLLQKGDVLFNNTNSPALVGKTSYYDEEEPRAFSNHMTRVRCRANALNPWYCALVLHQLWREQHFQRVCNNHVGQSSISRSVLAEAPIPLPPLAEQRRIVAAVEAVLARVNPARDRLNRVPTLLKRFRQSVLAAACSGRLTADWREQQSDTERAATFAGLTIKPLEELPENDTSLPESWAWFRFGDLIGELKNGLSPRPNQTPPGNPILRINAVRPGEVLFDDLRYLPDTDELVPSYSLRDRDLLFTRYNGSLDLLGVCGLVRGLNGRVMLYPDKLMRVRFSSSAVLPEYCELFFSEPAARERMIARSKSSAGQNGVSGSDVKAQPLALPPLPEQQEIVRRVAALFALADRIEAKLAAARQRVDALTQAVLAKAFRGELVPTEAELARREGRGYEPATALLERIRAERATAPGIKTGRRPR